MNSQSTYSDRAPGPADAPTRARIESDRAVAPQWRERKAERKRARLVSARNRRVLAQRLRRTAKTAHDPDPIRLHREALLHTAPRPFAPTCSRSQPCASTHATTRRA
jgi:hypothetical protein